MGAMWVAGDGYMEDAKIILDSTYSQSRPSTCQALLLLGYREIGIGAMAQAWLYIGMAVRMAQDLGLHKNADQWSHVGKTLFTGSELQERRRIWYGCVVMDKYVSSYIGERVSMGLARAATDTIGSGRPVSIFEHDFDTELPSADEVRLRLIGRSPSSTIATPQADELEAWTTHASPVYLDDGKEEYSPAPITATGHVISCFNESAKLCEFLHGRERCRILTYLHSDHLEHDHAGRLSHSPS